MTPFASTTLLPTVTVSNSGIIVYIVHSGGRSVVPSYSDSGVGCNCWPISHESEATTFNTIRWEVKVI